MDVVAPTVAVTLSSLSPLFVPLSVLRVHPEKRREQLPLPPQNRTCTLFILDDVARRRSGGGCRHNGLYKGTPSDEENLNEKTTRTRSKYEGIARILRESSL